MGYLVIGVDHPFDSAFIEYPDNSTAVRVNETIGTPEDAAITVNIRVEDLQSVLDFLSTNATFARQIPGVHGRLHFDVGKVGVFGHSLGGAASASAVATDSRFGCGVNMDGSLHGDVITTGVDKPFFMMASEGHNRSNDPSWDGFLGNSKKGEVLGLEVRGSRHADFEDFSVLDDEVLATGVDIPGAEGLFGSIGGKRMLELVGTFVGAWFDRCLEGEREVVLEGSSKEWPEVEFWNL